MYFSLLATKFVSKFKGTPREIGTKKGNLIHKKKIIIQHGDFLNIFILIALSALMDFIIRVCYTKYFLVSENNFSKDVASKKLTKCHETMTKI